MKLTLVITAFLCVCSTAIATVYEDKEATFCKTIHDKNPEFCQDSCFSDFCKKTCAPRPRVCLDCHGVTSPEECERKMTCPGIDYECATIKAVSGDRKIFILGCAEKQSCDLTGEQGSRKVITSETVTTITTTPIIPTTRLSMTSTKPSTMSTTSTKPSTISATTMTKLQYSTESTTMKPVRQYLIGKRSIFFQNMTCCNTDNCNGVSPEQTAVKRSVSYRQKLTVRGSYSSSTCADYDSTACVFLYMVKPDICTADRCVAESLCPKLCGFCHECYSCIDIASVGDCKTTEVCGQGQKCFHMETNTADFTVQNTLGCMDTSMCSVFDATNTVGRIIGRRRRSASPRGGCCSGNLCNGNLLNIYGNGKTQVSTTSPIKETTTTSSTTKTTTTAAKTTTTTPRPTTTTTKITTTTERPTTTTTTPKPTTTITAATTLPIECLHRADQCPEGFTMTAHGCFSAKRTRMTWSDAKRYCQSKCAKLADFSGPQEAHDVINEMINVHGSTLYHHSVHAFLDGQYTNNIWTWSSTGQNIAISLTSSSSFHHLSHHSYCMTVSTASEGRKRRDGSGTLAKTVLKPVSCTSKYYPLCEFTYSLKHYHNPVSLSNLGSGDD